MNKRTLATDVSARARKEVLERDDYRCIFCKTTECLTMAHYIPRSKGGLGIKENLVTACSICHWKLDKSNQRKNLLAFVGAYLDYFYPKFTDERRIYKK